MIKITLETFPHSVEVTVTLVRGLHETRLSQVEYLKSSLGPVGALRQSIVHLRSVIEADQPEPTEPT